MRLIASPGLEEAFEANTPSILFVLTLCLRHRSNLAFQIFTKDLIVPNERYLNHLNFVCIFLGDPGLEGLLYERF